MDKNANRNTFWAHTLVEELLRCGLETVVIAPGSRSTPLALAFGSLGRIEQAHGSVPTPGQAGLSVFVHPDERGAAYFALGAALASGKPAAVLCTSGTAAANFFPAVVEAHQAQVPLLILTADRPAELRESGANQTIDQVKLFGGYVRWAVETPVPEANPDRTLIQALRSLADRAMAAASGPPAGPVHINLPFRKPLEPTAVPGDLPGSLALPGGGFEDEPPGSRPWAHISPGKISAGQAQIQALAGAVRRARRGLITCGPRCPGAGFPEAVFRLAQATGFPIFADALSGLRFHPALPAQPVLLSGGYETFLSSSAVGELAQPDLVLQFGALPISKALGDLLAGLKNAPQVSNPIQPGLGG